MFKKLLLIGIFLIPLNAYAQTKVAIHCARDYLANCAEYPTATEAAKKCMLDVGINLSEKCVQAMVDDGYVTKEQVITFAKNRGVTVIDTPNGLVKAPTTLVVEKTIKVAPTETKVVLENIKKEVKKTIQTATKTTKKVAASISKKAKEVKVATQKKMQSTKAYNDREDIKKQNKLRSIDIENGTIPTSGHNANFGKYEPLPRLYTKKKFETDWVKTINEGQLRSGGIGAKF